MARHRVRALDVAASALVRVVPRSLEPLVDQARLDAESLVDGITGKRVQSFSTRQAPPLRPAPLRAIDPLREVLPRPLAERYDVIVRDVRTVLSELRGDRMPAIVPRPPRKVASAPSARTATASSRALVVSRLVRETEDALSVELADPSGAPIAFVPGQFLTLHVTVDGTVRRRAYSICSTPSDGPTATITIKRIEGGLVSTHLHRTLREGDRLTVNGPSGSFAVPPSSAPRHLVFFAGGSGITPIASMLRTALATEPGARITLVFGNRSERDIIFRDRLDALVREHASRLRVVHLLGERGSIPGARVGVPDEATVRALVAELALDARLPGEDPPRFFVCGPAPMMASVRAALSHAGVENDRIAEERFLSPADRAPAAPSAPQPITVRRRGTLRTFHTRAGETILEAATRNGVDMPSSCTMGGCGACRCRAVEGRVDVEEPSCLTDAERAEGLVLTCVGRAASPVTLEVP